MDRVKQYLISALLCLAAGSASATYVTATPPTGVTYAGGVLNTTFAASDLSFANGIRGKVMGLNAGGTAVSVPAAFKYTASAGRIAARAVFPYANTILVGLAVGDAIYDWYTSGTGYALDSSGNIYKPGQTSYSWTKQGSNCTQGSTFNISSYPPLETAQRCSGGDITQLTEPAWNVPTSNYCFQYRSSYVAFSTLSFCGTYVNTQTSTVSAQQFEDALAAKPVPKGLHPKIPNVALPVDLPIFNPTSDETNPVAQPLRVALNSPTAIAGTSPQQYKYDALDLTSAATQTEPYRAEVKPVTVTTTTATAPSSVSTPTTTGTTTTDSTKSSFCLENPTSAGCLDATIIPVEPDLERVNRSATITPDSGWSDGVGFCPANISLIHGEFSYTGVCNFMRAVKPVLLTFAWLMAAFIVLGATRSRD